MCNEFLKFVSERYRPPVLEVATWQTGKFYLPAVRSDNEKGIVRHYAASQGNASRRCAARTDQRRVVLLILWTFTFAIYTVTRGVRTVCAMRPLL
jgi:hypothetical protein